MKIIAITGGIGSGKSKVANYLIEKGYPVYSADDRAKQLLIQENIRLKMMDLLTLQWNLLLAWLLPIWPNQILPLTLICLI